jgi:hypothetical protein
MTKSTISLKIRQLLTPNTSTNYTGYLPFPNAIYVLVLLMPESSTPHLHINKRNKGPTPLKTILIQSKVVLEI